MTSTTYLPAEVWTRAFRLNNLTGALESLSPGIGEDPPETMTSGADDLMAGQALWVYAAKAGVIVPK